MGRSLREETHTVKVSYFSHPPVLGTITTPLRLVVKSLHPVPPETMRKEPSFEYDATKNLKLKESTATPWGGGGGGDT